MMDCVTRELSRHGHNLGLDGAPKSAGPCRPCDDRTCAYIGPICGCRAHNCVDWAKEKMQDLDTRANGGSYPPARGD
jgi:hypothetical protein